MKAPAGNNVHAITKALCARYPGVRIVEVAMAPKHDGEPQQFVRFQAPIERLIECGLLTVGMIEQSRARGYRETTTPMGCGFSLSEGGFDSASMPGCADLAICTGLTPRERPRMAVRDAKKALRRFALAGARKNRLASESEK